MTSAMLETGLKKAISYAQREESKGREYAAFYHYLQGWVGSELLPISLIELKKGEESEIA